MGDDSKFIMKAQYTGTGSRRCLAALLAVLFSFGCATTYTEQRVQPVRVVTNPSRAWVYQKDEKGEHVLGQAPLVARTRYQVVKKKLNPWWWAVVGGTAVVAGVGVAFYNSNSDAGKYVTYAGSAALGLSLMTWYFLQRWIGGETPAEPREVTLGARLDGYLEQQTSLMIPGQDSSVSLVLPPDPAHPPRPRPATVARAAFTPSAGSSRQVLAVFDVQDASGKMRAGALDQLTDYLAARLTQVTRFRILPRDQIHARLAQQKKGSYRKCYDESCQIELGKALAARKTLATKILKVGRRCAITSTMYDLKTETADASALVKTDCDADSLLDSMDRVARQLSAGDFR